VLAVPDGVHVRKVDLGQELQILAYHEHRRTAAPPPDQHVLVAPESKDLVS
jgi:redox-sensing transcriptional repressor